MKRGLHLRQTWPLWTSSYGVTSRIWCTGRLNRVRLICERTLLPHVKVSRQRCCSACISRPCNALANALKLVASPLNICCVDVPINNYYYFVLISFVLTLTVGITVFVAGGTCLHKKTPNEKESRYGQGPTLVRRVTLEPHTDIWLSWRGRG